MSWKFKDVLLPPIEVYIYNMCVFPHDLVDAAFEIMRVTRWGACLFSQRKWKYHWDNINCCDTSGGFFSNITGNCWET